MRQQEGNVLCVSKTKHDPNMLPLMTSPPV